MIGGRLVRALLGAVSVVALSGALSGCFILRTLSYSNDKVEAGHKTTAKMTVQPVRGGPLVRAATRVARGGGPSVPERPFFAMVSEASPQLSFRQGVWDPTKQLDDGKRKLIGDPDLADVISNGDECSGFFSASPRAGGARRGGEVPFKVVRTDRKVTVSGPEQRKIVHANVPIKVPGSNDSFAVLLIMFSGTWIDDGDNVAEDPSTSGDDISCTGFSTSTVYVRH